MLVDGKAKGGRPQQGFERLRQWPEFFNLNIAARLLQVDNDTAAVYMTRWKQRGLVEAAGPRAGVYFNLVANRNAPDERLVDAARMEFPAAVLIGESVLHAAGWITQIPAKLQLATPSRRTYPQWDRVQFHGRSEAWYRLHHFCFLKPEKSSFPTFGLPALSPADALADVFGHAGHWHPDPDDLDIPEAAHAAVIRAFERAGVVPKGLDLGTGDQPERLQRERGRG